MKIKGIVITILLAISVHSLDAQTARLRILRLLKATGVVVSNILPIANVTLVSGFYVNNPWTISTGGTGDIDGTIASGTLDWGDGTTIPITGAPTATYEHTYTVVDEYAVTLTVTDNNGGQGQDTLIVNVRDIPPPGSGDGNEYFEYWADQPETERAFAMRSQSELEARTANTQGLGSQWTYVWPSADPADCYQNLCNDEHPIAPNGGRLRLPPKGWRRDRISYPDGAFLYPEHFNKGATGNEGVGNPGRLRTPIGASLAAGWNTTTVVTDVWWSREYQTNRGAQEGYKNIFIHSGADASSTGATDTYFTEHVHLTAHSPNLSLGEVAHPRFQGNDTPLSDGLQENDPYQPTGLGALPLGQCVYHYDKWSRAVYNFEMEKAGVDFTDWFALVGVTPGTPRNMLSVYMWDEDRDPMLCMYKVPLRYSIDTAAIANYQLSWDQSDNILNQEEKQILDLTTMELGDTATITVPPFTNTRLGLTTLQETTGSFSYSTDMSAAIKAELEALDGIDIVIVEKNSTTQNYTLRFIGSPSGMTDIGTVTINPTDAGGSITFAPDVYTTTRQLVNLLNAEDGDKFNMTVRTVNISTRFLTVQSTPSTENIDTPEDELIVYSTTPSVTMANMEAALEKLSSVSDVTITQATGTNRFIVNFVNPPNGTTKLSNMSVFERLDAGGVLNFTPSMFSPQEGNTLSSKSSGGVYHIYTRNHLVLKNFNIFTAGPTFYERPRP